MEENSRYIIALEENPADNDDTVQEALDESERSMAVLLEKQARIDKLEGAMVENRRLLSDHNRANSSRQAALDN